jgi:molybdenum cofactor cytidylyltransferase
MPRVIVAVVLAAGRATRFGSSKVLAALDDRPVLQHVLDRIAGEVAETIVVLGEDAEAVEAAIAWPAGVRRVRNRDPSRGLGSSLAIGMAAARDRMPQADGIVIALGDQPRVDPAVVRALIAMLDDPCPIKVPRYSDEANPNPVVLAPAAFDLVGEVSGDRGLGPVIARHPELVHELPVTGWNPDVDTPADLEALGRTPDETHPTGLRHPVS